MELKEGMGNDGDNFDKKCIWVMDTADFPSYKAEYYKQYNQSLKTQQ